MIKIVFIVSLLILPNLCGCMVASKRETQSAKYQEDVSRYWVFDASVAYVGKEREVAEKIISLLEEKSGNDELDTMHLLNNIIINNVTVQNKCDWCLRAQDTSPHYRKKYENICHSLDKIMRIVFDSMHTNSATDMKPVPVSIELSYLEDEMSLQERTTGMVEMPFSLLFMFYTLGFYFPTSEIVTVKMSLCMDEACSQLSRVDSVGSCIGHGFYTIADKFRDPEAYVCALAEALKNAAVNMNK